MNNLDMAKLMSLLSKMDKSDLEKGLAQANQLFNSKDKEKIIDEVKKNNE